MKILLQTINPYVRLYRDDKTGIAWVENNSLGIAHSAHPNIDESGSVKGMKNLYWGQDAKTVKCNGFVYNISSVICDDEYDELARQHCLCGGIH